MQRWHSPPAPFGRVRPPPALDDGAYVENSKGHWTRRSASRPLPSSPCSSDSPGTRPCRLTWSSPRARAASRPSRWSFGRRALPPAAAPADDALRDWVLAAVADAGDALSCLYRDSQGDPTLHGVYRRRPSRTSAPHSPSCRTCGAPFREEALRRRARHPHRHRRLRRHRRPRRPTPLVGARFGLSLAWVVVVGVVGICVFAEMSGRVAAVSGRGRRSTWSASGSGRGSGWPTCSRSIVGHLADPHRRDRRRRPRPRAGHQRQLPAAGPGRRRCSSGWCCGG